MKTAILPVGSMALPGDLVRQVQKAPIEGRVSSTVPLQVDQRTGKVQFLVEWDETAEDGSVAVASTWFEAADVEILERPSAE